MILLMTKYNLEYFTVWRKDSWNTILGKKAIHTYKDEPVYALGIL